MNVIGLVKVICIFMVVIFKVLFLFVVQKRISKVVCVVRLRVNLYKIINLEEVKLEIDMKK